MEKLISGRSHLPFVPESFILPPESRPGQTKFPPCDSIPVIDLGGQLGFDRAQLVKQIIQASQEFGFFQLTNHGVSEKLMHDVLDVANEFFGLPAKDKESLYSEDPKQTCRVHTSINYDREKVHYWRDNLRHPCHPLEEHMPFWPEKPPRYREVIGSYSAGVRKLSLWILDLIGEGLGLESGYFRDELSQVQFISVNHYPPCPDPSLTLGLPKHCDPNLITLVLQGKVQGLQVLKDGQWLAVEPLPNAFVVNIGYMLQIMSNGKLSSAEHRVMTNKEVARTTVSSFLYPSNTCRVGPLKTLLCDCIRPLYRDFVFKDFLSTYADDTPAGVPPLERYKIRALILEMEKLISSRSHLQFVAESYILPLESRPGQTEVPLCETIPVIDMGGELGSDRGQLVKQIIQASQEFGFFQLINHGVPEKLMHDVLDVAKEFFELPAEDKASLYSEDPKQNCRLYTSIDYETEKGCGWELFRRGEEAEFVAFGYNLRRIRT